jgi:lysine biosynthesis protein LysW
MINCPECNGALDLEEDELDVGDEFTCEECGATLRVLDTDPLELDLADDEDDDDDEEGDDEFDEEEGEEEEEDEGWR